MKRLQRLRGMLAAARQQRGEFSRQWLRTGRETLSRKRGERKERTDQQRSGWASFDVVLMGWHGMRWMLFGERDTMSCLGEQKRRVWLCVDARD